MRTHPDGRPRALALLAAALVLSVADGPRAGHSRPAGTVAGTLREQQIEAAELMARSLAVIRALPLCLG
jgi:hypothetical protein